jgi:hypothetical protein
MAASRDQPDRLRTLRDRFDQALATTSSPSGSAPTRYTVRIVSKLALSL